MVWIPRNDLPDYSIDASDLKLKYQSGYGASERVETLKLYVPEKLVVGIPRAYFYRAAGSAAGSVKDCRTRGRHVKFPFKSTLRPNQVEITDTFYKHLIDSPHNGGILCAPCGAGKTVMALHTIARLERSTLVIVHTSRLLNQWIERIEEHMGITAGVIREDAFETDADIVVAMLQTLLSRGYTAKDLSMFGTCAVDETHRVAAPTWSSVIKSLPMKYRLGLTATPRRSDKLDNAFFFHIGKVLAKSEKREMKPRIYFVNTNVGFRVPMLGNGKVNRARALNILAKNKERNRKISKEIVKAIKSDRVILVLSDRMELLYHQRRLLKERDIPDDKIGWVVGAHWAGVDPDDPSEDLEQERTASGPPKAVLRAVKKIVQEHAPHEEVTVEGKWIFVSGANTLPIDDLLAIPGLTKGKYKGNTIGLATKIVGGQPKTVKIPEAQMKENQKRQILLATFGLACVDINTNIVDPLTGHSNLLRDLIGTKPEIVSASNCTGKLVTASCVAYSGIKECVKVTIADNSLVLSNDHLVFTHRGKVPAGDLTTQDYILRPRIVKCPTRSIDVDKDDMWLAGMLLGDGAISQIHKRIAQVINADEEVLEHVSSILNNRGMLIKKVKCRDYHYWIRSKKGKAGRGAKTWLRRFVERWGLSNTARFKHIPIEWMMSSTHLIKSLLGGLFASDGHVDNRGTPGFSSSSRRMAEQVRFLLWRLGLQSTIRKSESTWSIGVPASSALRLDIDWRITRKANRLDEHNRMHNKLSLGTWNKIPVHLVLRIKEIAKTKGVKIEEMIRLCRKYGYAATNLRHNQLEVTYEVASLLMEILGVEDAPELQNIKNFHFMPVLNIETVGPRPVGDMTVPGLHRWVTNGMLIHNSEGLDIPAVDVLVLATPRSDVEQAVGRALRTLPGKKQPIIVDFVDAASYFQALKGKRRRQYRKLGYEVVETRS